MKPTVTVNSVKVGTYSLDLDVTINDEGGYLKKVTSRVIWNNQKNEQRKSIRESGTYTISNLESDHEMELILEMKYRNTLGEYVTEEVYRTTIKTLSIADGTNTLHLNYQPDTWTADTKGGYEQIYPDQIEIRHMTVREGNDSVLEDAGSTMDYVRYFRINVYDVKGSASDPVATYTLSNSDKKKMLNVEATEDSSEEGSGEDGTGTGSDENNGTSTPAENYLDWKSDKVTSPLNAAGEYYYEFELTDRYGESLKVEYEDDADGKSRYTGDQKDPDKLLKGKDSDRKAYTCKQHPTGKLTMGSASYDSQTINVTLNNPDLSIVSDLYLTVQDSYGRYIGHTYNEDTKAITGSVEGADLNAKTRYMLMKGVTAGGQGKLKLYEGVEGAGQSAYDSSKQEQSWDKIKVPSFANSTYTVKLNISYDIGDRYGDLDEDNNRTGVYTKELAVRTNCKTTSLNTLGNVSFNRAAGTMYSDQVVYDYASAEISQRLLPMIYRYDYELKNTTVDSDVPMKLRVSKDYSEINETQGVLLSIPGP